MNMEKLKSNELQPGLANAERYAAPDIEVVEIELIQNILQGSGFGNAPGDFEGEDW